MNFRLSASFGVVAVFLPTDTQRDEIEYDVYVTLDAAIMNGESFKGNLLHPDVIDTKTTKHCVDGLLTSIMINCHDDGSYNTTDLM